MSRANITPLKNLLTLACQLTMGVIYKPANFSNTDLTGCNFILARLAEANLSGANMRSVDFLRADLEKANLRDADLRRADLRQTDLRDADLRTESTAFAGMNRVSTAANSHSTIKRIIS